MVFFYTSQSNPEAIIFMGKGKEIKKLLDYSFPRDVQFHVHKCKTSESNPLYLRLEGLKDLRKIPKKLLKEMCQLTKANSIAG